MKTRKQLERENFLKIYFHHWKLQNNPEYIEIWKKWKSGESVYPDWKNLLKKFGVLLGSVWPHPFKKIDWEDLVGSNKVDQEVVSALYYFSPSPVKLNFHNKSGNIFAKDNPTLTLDINLSYDNDKKDILEEVSSWIDEWRDVLRIEKSIKRDPISKLYIYAQVWDLRKDFPKKSFREIARELKRPLPTVVSQFKKAYELLYNKPYESTEHKAVVRSLIRKTTCKDCPEKSSCKIPCPDVQIQLEGLDVKQTHRLDRVFLDRHGEKKSTYELASDSEVYRKWQEEKLEKDN